MGEGFVFHPLLKITKTFSKLWKKSLNFMPENRNTFTSGPTSGGCGLVLIPGCDVDTKDDDEDIVM